MPIVKTELEGPYRPADFFEAPYHWQTDDYTLGANAGTVLVTLATPSDPIDAELQTQITKKVEGLFFARQLLVHRTFELESLRVCQRRSDGGKERSLSFTAKLSLTAAFDYLSVSEQPNAIIHNASGTVLQDSKSKRITEHTKFIDSIISKLSSSETLDALLESYNAAVSDPAKELAHLYDIRDALIKHYGKADEARRRLGISVED